MILLIHYAFNEHYSTHYQNTILNRTHKVYDSSWIFDDLYNLNIVFHIFQMSDINYGV